MTVFAFSRRVLCEPVAVHLLRLAAGFVPLVSRSRAGGALPIRNENEDTVIIFTCSSNVSPYHQTAMAITSKMPSTLCRSIARRSLPHGSRLNAFAPAIALRTSFATTTTARQGCNSSKPSGSCSQAGTAPKPLSITSADFWSSRSTWQRAGVNTLRCLVGCTLGDFSAMWYLQAFHPDLGTGAIMGISS